LLGSARHGSILGDAAPGRNDIDPTYPASVGLGAARSPRGARAIDPAVVARTIFLLVLSNVFMTFAWYGHLKTLIDKPWYWAVLVSWGLALFEYLLQVPANRIGFGTLSLAQLKILQEVITLAVFVPFSIFYMGSALKLDYLWAGLCMVGAVFFIFRSP